MAVRRSIYSHEMAFQRLVYRIYSHKMAFQNPEVGVVQPHPGRCQVRDLIITVTLPGCFASAFINHQVGGGGGL